MIKKRKLNDLSLTLSRQLLPQTLARVCIGIEEFDAWVKENPGLAKMVFLIAKDKDGIYRNVSAEELI